MDFEESALCMRLCRCLPGEVVDIAEANTPTAGSSHGARIILGSIIQASWLPSRPDTLGLLYSSGVFRLWNVVEDKRADYALYFPVQGLSEGENVVDRRIPAIITRFSSMTTNSMLFQDFGKSICRLVFSLQRDRKVHIVDLPEGAFEAARQEEAPDGLRFARGFPVYDCNPAVDGEVTVIQCWQACSLPSPVWICALGCSTGSLHVWSLGSSLNPTHTQSAAGMGGVRASPRMARIASFTPAAAVEERQAGMAMSTLPSMSSSTSCAHKGAIRAITPLPLSHVLHGRGSVTQADNTWATAGDDGRVRLWHMHRSEPSSPASSATAAGPVFLSVSCVGELPTDGVPVQALTAAPWPWTWGTRGGGGAEVVAQAEALGHSVFLCTGSREGVVCVWEVVLHHATVDLTQEGPTGGAGAAQALYGPCVRLVTMSAARPCEPITSMALASPLSPPHTTPAAEGQPGVPWRVAGVSASAYSLVVGATDGSLAHYLLAGAVSVGSDSPVSPGGSPPVHLHQHALIPAAPASTAGTTATSPEEQGVEGQLLSALAQATGDLQRVSGDEATAAAEAHLLTGSTIGRRVVGALTASALARYSRTPVAIVFNRADEASAGDSMVHGALAACTAGGEVQLWSRQCLPGDEMAVEEAARQAEENKRREEAEAKAKAEELEALRRAAEHPLARPSRGASPPSSPRSPSPMDTQLVHEPEPEPRAPQGEGLPRAATPPPLPRVLSGTVSSMARLQAVGATLAALRDARERDALGSRGSGASAGGRGRSISRSKSPARAFLRTAAGDAVRSMYGTLGRSPSSSSSGKARSGMTPVDRARARVLSAVERATSPAPARTATAPAIAPLADRQEGMQGSGSRGSDTAARRLSSSSGISWSALKPGVHGVGALGDSAHARGGGGGGTVEDGPGAGDGATGTVTATGTTGTEDVGRDPGALDDSTATGSRGGSRTGGGSRPGRSGRSATAQQEQGRGGGGAVLVDMTGQLMQGEEDVSDSDGGEEEGPAAGRSMSPSSPSARRTALRDQRLHRRTAGPFLHARFRSPARLSAALEREAITRIRSTTLLAKEAEGAAGAAISEHPDATLMYRRAVPPPGGEPGTGPGQASHLVAPTLGSTASIAMAIARLQAQTFDEEACLAEVLGERGIQDKAVRDMCVQRVRARAQQASEPGQGQGAGAHARRRVPHPSTVLTIPAHAPLYSQALLPPPWPHHAEERRRSRSRSKSLQPQAAIAAAETEEAVLKRAEAGMSAVHVEDAHCPVPRGGSPGAPRDFTLLTPRVTLPRTRPGESVTAADMLGWRHGLRGGMAGAPLQAVAAASSESKRRGVSRERGDRGTEVQAQGTRGAQDTVATLASTQAWRSTGAGASALDFFLFHQGRVSGGAILQVSLPTRQHQDGHRQE